MKYAARDPADRAVRSPTAPSHPTVPSPGTLEFQKNLVAVDFNMKLLQEFCKNKGEMNLSLTPKTMLRTTFNISCSVVCSGMKGMYEVWRTLPEVIRQDPAFDPFRRFGMRQEDSSPLESPATASARKKKLVTLFCCVVCNSFSIQLHEQWYFYVI